MLQTGDDSIFEYGYTRITTARVSRSPVVQTWRDVVHMFDDSAGVTTAPVRRPRECDTNLSSVYICHWPPRVQWHHFLRKQRPPADCKSATRPSTKNSIAIYACVESQPLRESHSRIKKVFTALCGVQRMRKYLECLTYKWQSVIFKWHTEYIIFNFYFNF